jgi:hypothetical protein
MSKYYVNKNAQTTSGDHEVHTVNCIYLPLEKNRLYLGVFDSCGPALREARKTYSNADGCATCCPRCHKG